MISEIRIRNFKSIHDLRLKLGRVTVLIGENGSGKSNLLEAIGFAGCAAANKLDNAVLASRGIRVCEPELMSAAFGEEPPESQGIEFEICEGGSASSMEFRVKPVLFGEDEQSKGWGVLPLWEGVSDPPEALLSQATQTPKLEAKVKVRVSETIDWIRKDVDSSGELLKFSDDEVSRLLGPIFVKLELAARRRADFSGIASFMGLSDFMIFAPENTLLRTPPPEGVVLPLGCKGEGLFRHLESFGEPGRERELADMKERLRIFGWFEDFLAPDRAAVSQARLQIRDRWLAPGRAVIDQRSANEGFLYLLFYFALMMSPRTPRFFAIDNLDNALNPKLCAALMRQITELAVRYDKQVICTTHNPAILDGLDLHDDGQRLYSVQRDEEGRTTVNRVRPPQPMPGETPVKLSAAFLAGYIGGLPEHF